MCAGKREGREGETEGKGKMEKGKGKGKSGTGEKGKIESREREKGKGKSEMKQAIEGIVQFQTCFPASPFLRKHRSRPGFRGAGRCAPLCLFVQVPSCSRAGKHQAGSREGQDRAQAGHRQAGSPGPR